MGKFVAVNLCLILLLSGTIHILTAFGVGKDMDCAGYSGTTTAQASLEMPTTLTKVQESEPEKSPALKNRWGIKLSADEVDMMARIIMLEAGGESDRGQQAVAEVILNRVYSDEFPDTVYEVLSQETNGCRQFVTWKNRNLDAAVPSDRVKRNVRTVLDGDTDILPFKTMYFSQKGENKNVQCVIGGHVFCNQP